MSKAIVTYADAGNNDYKIRIPGQSTTMSAQCVTLDELQVGDEVVMVDLDNLPPHKVRTKGKIRILPSRGNYTYDVNSRWYKASELNSLNKKASLMYSYIYSSDRNPAWQKESPLYRKGTIQKIHDAKYVDVEITWPWKGNLTETKRCRIDYMTCDTVAFSVGDTVVVKFVNSDPRRPYVVGKWDDPGLCEGYLYFAIKIDQRITDFTGGTTSEESVSSTSSSSSQESKSSESASSDSDTLKGLDDYYAFVWDPKVNDFAVINDPVTGLPIPFPCRADRLESWLLDSSDITQTSMSNRRSGREAMSSGAGWGLSKRWFIQGHWNDFIPEIGQNLTEITIGGQGGYYYDDATPMGDCSDPGSCITDYWTDTAAEYSGPPWYILAKCGSFESGVITLANPLTGLDDTANFSVNRTCTPGGGDSGLIVAGSSITAVFMPAEYSNHDVLSSYIHELDGFQVQTITSEDYNYYYLGPGSGYTGYSDVEYSTTTFLGNLYNAWAIREYNYDGVDYYAQALLSQVYTIGRRCAAGTFVCLGLQGVTTKAENYGDPVNWVIQNKYRYFQAYCDTGTYGEDPFTGKVDNTKISDAIKAMIDRFYEEDPGGAVLDFETDVRWVSGPTGSYSSLSSSSTSSSSLSSSSESVSKESSSSESVSSTSSSSISSESIP